MAEIGSLLMMPVVGGLIGWGTNMIAIRMLFYPRRPWVVPFLGWRLQGLLPRHQEDFARALGEVVAEHLVRSQEIFDRIDVNELRTEMVQRLSEYVDDRLRSALPGFLPEGWRQAATAYVQEVVGREAGSLLSQTLPAMLKEAQARLDIAALVQEKVRAFDLQRLEDMVRSLSHRELRAIELWGLVLGVLVGILQAGVIRLIG
ncbi:MAG: DUF445 family protein [Limnochordaceae bacterium]|nr:DUF445 family protein [Limnochordaceae bacterium]